VAKLHGLRPGSRHAKRQGAQEFRPRLTMRDLSPALFAIKADLRRAGRKGTKSDPGRHAASAQSSETVWVMLIALHSQLMGFRRGPFARPW